MSPSRYLPDAAQMDALFAGALSSAKTSRSFLAGGRQLRFPASSTQAEEGAGPLPLAELHEDGLESAIAGETLDARLDALLLWLVGSTGAFAAFVADGEGLALANRHAPENYLVATAALAIVERTMNEVVMRPKEGNTTFDLDGANVLQIIWASTSVGRLAIGLVLAAPLDRALAGKARCALRLAVESKGMVR